MELEVGKAPHPLVWIAAIVLIVLSGAGVAALMGWIPAWTDSSGGKVGIISGTIQSNA
jgi:hypothetical protein